MSEPLRSLNPDGSALGAGLPPRGSGPPSLSSPSGTGSRWYSPRRGRMAIFPGTKRSFCPPDILRPGPTSPTPSGGSSSSFGSGGCFRAYVDAPRGWGSSSRDIVPVGRSDWIGSLWGKSASVPSP